jgi:hypothetical protein
VLLCFCLPSTSWAGRWPDFSWSQPGSLCPVLDFVSRARGVFRPRPRSFSTGARVRASARFPLSRSLRAGTRPPGVCRPVLRTRRRSIFFCQRRTVPLHSRFRSVARCRRTQFQLGVPFPRRSELPPILPPGAAGFCVRTAPPLLGFRCLIFVPASDFVVRLVLPARSSVFHSPRFFSARAAVLRSRSGATEAVSADYHSRAGSTGLSCSFSYPLSFVRVWWNDVGKKLCWSSVDFWSYFWAIRSNTLRFFCTHYVFVVICQLQVFESVCCHFVGPILFILVSFVSCLYLGVLPLWVKIV